MPNDYERFEEWSKKVDAIVIRKTDLSKDDLPDYDYYSAFQAGDTPSQAARDVIRAAKED